MKQMILSMKGRSMMLFRTEGLVPIVILNILFGLSMSFITPFNSMFGIDEVGMSNTAFGIFMTVSAIANVVISMYIGKLSDGRANRRTMILICAAAAVIGYAGYAFSRNYYVLLLIASLVLGVSSSSFSQIFAYARETLTRSQLPTQEMPFYMNIFRMFFALSWTFGPALAAYVLIGVGFKGLFLLAAFLFVLIMLVVLLFLKSGPAPAPTERSETAAAPPAVSLVRLTLRPDIFLHLLAFTFVSAATTMGSLNMSQFLTKVLHSGQQQIGVVFSIPPFFEIPLMLFFGALATRIDNRVLIRLGVLFAFLYFALLFCVTNTTQVYVAQIFSAAAISITNGIAITYFQNFIPNMPGVATSLYMNTSKIGQTIAFLLFGFTSAWFGYRSVYLVCTIFAAVALLMLVVLSKLRRSYSWGDSAAVDQ